MNNKRNSLKVLSALFAFCNLFSVMGISAMRGKNTKNHNDSEVFEFKRKGFSVLRYIDIDGTQLVYTPDSNYKTCKEKIDMEIEEIKKKRGYTNFFVVA